MKRLEMIDAHAKSQAKVTQDQLKPKSNKPYSNIWDGMGLDDKLSQKAIALRKATALMMESIADKLEPHYEKTEFPDWVVDKLRSLKINGLNLKGYGSPGLTTTEMGALVYEMAKVDAGVASFMLVHNAIGMAVVHSLGDEEQKQRILPPAINFERILAFGLTEPLNGSDASSLTTTAVKVEGGYKLNGHKRWIGNATFADVIVWARNLSDGNKVQGFLVEKGTPGFNAQKMDGKWALRMTQNGSITIKDCFVPDKNKIAKANDFSDTNSVLETSRLAVAWCGCGVAAGAYENALKYTLSRKQFGKPIAQFQLVQERLSRMLSNCEFSLALLVRLSEQIDAGKATFGQIARAKAHVTKLGRETVSLAREVCGGNGILMENKVIKAFLDMEAVYTYEGTYDINSLVSGRELTGGLSAIK